MRDPVQKKNRPLILFTSYFSFRCCLPYLSYRRPHKPQAGFASKRRAKICFFFNLFKSLRSCVNSFNYIMNCVVNLFVH